MNRIWSRQQRSLEAGAAPLVRRVVVCLAFSALVGMVVFSLPAEAADIKLAVWKLKPLGLDPPTAERLEVLLRSEASQLRGFSLQSVQRTEEILARDENAELLSCGGETTCLSQIGKNLGVDKLITGVIGALGEDYTFDLKLVDVVSGREERRINEALSGREDLLIGAIRQALCKLVVPDELVGSVILDVPVRGAEVLVDDKMVGMTPLPKPVTGLRPGNHKLQIRKMGFSTFAHEVSVRFQQTTRVKVDLISSMVTDLSYESEGAPQTTAPPPFVRVERKKLKMTTTRVAAWSTAAAASASLALGGFLGWRSSVALHQVNEAKANLTLSAVHVGISKRGTDYALAANVCYGVSGAAAVASLVLFLIDRKGAVEVLEPGANPGVGFSGQEIVLNWRF